MRAVALVARSDLRRRWIGAVAVAVLAMATTGWLSGFPPIEP